MVSLFSTNNGFIFSDRGLSLSQIVARSRLIIALTLSRLRDAPIQDSIHDMGARWLHYEAEDGKCCVQGVPQGQTGRSGGGIFPCHLCR